jgi:hypothetical protein
MLQAGRSRFRFPIRFFFVGWDLSPLRSLFRSPRFRFVRSLCFKSPRYKSQHCGHISLLYIPRMIYEGDCGVIGGANDDYRGNQVLGENVPQRHFVQPQIPHDQVRFRTPDRSGGKPATNRLSYGAASDEVTGFLN